MALADYNAYEDLIKNTPPIFFSKAMGTATANRLMSNFLSGPFAGTAPTAATACGRDTIGDVLQAPRVGVTTNPLYIAQIELASDILQMGSYMIVDRLAHQGGLSGTSTATQTTNFPLAPNRYTNGVGVQIAIEVYTAVGGTATTVTASYTNQAGTSGRTTKAVSFGGTNNNAANQLFPLPLQDGDTGVQSVQSVTQAASTAVAGNYGVTMYKFHKILPNIGRVNSPIYSDGLLCSGIKLNELHDDACVNMFSMVTTAAGFIATGSMRIIEVA